MPITYLDDSPSKITYLDETLTEASPVSIAPSIERPSHEEDRFADLSAGDALRINPNVGRVVRPSTIAGGPRVPLASYAETAESLQEGASPLTRFIAPRQTLTEPRVSLPSVPIKPDASFWQAAGAEAVNAAKSLPEFATSDAGILSAIGAKLSPRLVSAGFSADLTISAFQQAKQAYENWGRMTPADKGKATVDIISSLALGGLTGAGAAGLRLPARKPEIQGPLATGQVLKTPEGFTPKPEAVKVKSKAEEAPPVVEQGAPPAAPAAVAAGAEPAVETPGAAEPAKAEVTTSQGKEQTAERIVKAVGDADRNLHTITERFPIVGSDGKMYYGDLPFGVKSVGRGEPYYAFQTREGTTVGKRYATRAEAEAAHEQSAKRHEDEMRSALSEMTPDQIQSQADYWLKERTPPPEPSPKPTKQAKAQKPLGTGSSESDAKLAQYRKMKRSGAPMMASQEQALAMYEAQAKADPSKWSVGDGVGWRVHRQINRGFRIAAIDSERKLAQVVPVADIGLTVTGGGMEGIGPEWVHVADLVRDKKYNAPTPTHVSPAVEKVEAEVRWDKTPSVRAGGKPFFWNAYSGDGHWRVAWDRLQKKWSVTDANQIDKNGRSIEIASFDNEKEAKGHVEKLAAGKVAAPLAETETGGQAAKVVEPPPTPPATEGKGIPELQRLTEKVESGQALTPAEKKRYLNLSGRDKETPLQDISVGPGAASPGDVPPGAQIEHLTDAFKRITAEKPSLFDRIKESFDLGKKREMSQNLIARTLSALKTSGDYLIDTYKGQMDVDPILKVKGKLSAELETRGWRMRQAMAEMKRAVPNKLVREAISKYVDAGGDMVKLREASETVPPTRRAAYQRAMSLSPDEKVMAGHIQSFFEARLQEAMDAGVLSHGIEDYIHRIYPKDSPWRRGVINSVQNSILDTRTPGLARQRVFELDADAERAGYFPVSDFIPRILDYEASLSKVIASREAVKGFTEIKMPDGRPMLDVTGIGVPVENPEGVREATLIKPSFRPGEKQLDENGKPTKNYRRDYQSRDYPALKRWKWATNDAQGTPIFVEGDVLIHPDAVHRIDALLEPSKVRRYPVARAALTVGSVFKQTMLDFSGFHQAQISIHGMEHKVNPFRLVKDVDTNNPDVQGLLRGGMTLGGQHVSGMYEEGLVGRSLSRQIPGLGPLMESYHNWLFQNFIPRVKTTMAMHALERNRARFANDLKSGRMTNEALYYQTAKEANAAFGELNYIMLERSKTAQDLARLVLLAPDFLEARGRFAAQALTKHGGEQRMALLLGAITLYTTARVMNKALNDEWHFEPENMFSIIYNGKAYSIRTVQGDILHLMEEPVRFWLHRLNPTITRPLFELMTGRDEFGRKRDFWQVMGDTISNAIPISMRSGREQSIWTSMLNAFGGSVRRYSDIRHVYDLADKWKQKHGVRAQPGEFIYDPSKDIYRPLKLAILDGDTPAAASEYRKLIASKLVTAEQVGKHFQTYANAPFAGSKSNEQKFYQSLTADERKQYEGAKQERRRLLSGFRKAQSYQR